MKECTRMRCSEWALRRLGVHEEFCGGEYHGQMCIILLAVWTVGTDNSLKA